MAPCRTRSVALTGAASLALLMAVSPLSLAWAEDELPPEAPTISTPETTVSEPAPEPAPEFVEAVPQEPQPPAPAPEPVPVEEMRTVDNNTTERKVDPRRPRYELERPAWGTEISGAYQALGKAPGIPGLGSGKVRAVTLRMEWQPQFIQAIGVLSLGPALSLYPITSGNATSNPFSIWSAGGRVLYQARYFRNQPIVPIGGYSAEYLVYRLKSGQSGKLLTQGPVVGGMIFLNFFDRSGAADFYVNQGVLRSYLVGELRLLSGSDSNITISGNSLFAGVRFEF